MNQIWDKTYPSAQGTLPMKCPQNGRLGMILRHFRIDLWNWATNLCHRGDREGVGSQDRLGERRGGPRQTHTMCRYSPLSHQFYRYSSRNNHFSRLFTATAAICIGNTYNLCIHSPICINLCNFCTCSWVVSAGIF